jgi:imidazolonepropionase-like amidohydrolase
MRDIYQIFADARAYVQARQQTDSDQSFDARLEAMRPVVEGKIPIIVQADDLAQIESAVGFAAGQGIKIIILGGYDAPLCAELLIKHNVPVIVASTHRMPRRAHEPYDHAYTLPKRLLDAKVSFCISGTGRSETWNARNLPYHAGTAVGYGLPNDEALKAITLYPAQILGVSDRVGSLEAGKDATLIVTTGDPLETTSAVEMAFIQGRAVDLSNKQTKLYEKYREKYQRLKAQ